jgi:hypothetical protein
MFETAVEAVKFFGGLGGIASSIFLVYDRFVRNRPFAYLRPHDFAAELLVKNVAGEPIIIDEFDVVPPVVGFSRNNDRLSTIEAVAARFYPDQAGENARKVFVLIPPLGERGFHLVRLKDFDTLDGALPVKIRCAWRNTRKPLPLKQHVVVNTTVGDLRLIKDAADAAGRSK